MYIYVAGVDKWFKDFLTQSWYMYIFIGIKFDIVVINNNSTHEVSDQRYYKINTKNTTGH